MRSSHSGGRPHSASQSSHIAPSVVGREKEELACVLLTESEGYRVIQRNYRCRYGEIDIIATDGNVFAFVEVRYRREGGLVSALESLDRKKAGKLRLAVRSYTSLHVKDISPDTPLRIDLCVITDGEPGYRLLKGVLEF